MFDPVLFAALMGSTALFSPYSLFSSGEQGAWYDPSDFTTMFQDSTGTTPVTAVEQPVGLLLDKSKGLALGAELVTNGTFDSGITGWTKHAWTTDPISWDSTGKRLVVTNDLAYFGGATTPIAGLTIGKTYLATGIVSDNTIQCRLHLSGLSPTSPQINPGGGTATFIFVAAATSYTLAVTMGQDTLGGVAYWDNISVRELPGNHAFQATTASCPVLSARVNQLLATATLSTQNVTTLAATYTLAFSGAGTVTATGTNIGVYSAGSNLLVCTAGTLTLTVVGSVTLADLRVTNVGVGLPAYQAVVTSTNYDTSGFPLFLRFDGTDDSLATASIDFTATDKMSVFAGVRKLSDAATGMLMETGSGNPYVTAPETSGNYGVRVGAFVGYNPATFAAPITNVISIGMNRAATTNATAAAVRINTAINTASPTGTPPVGGNYSNAALYIGRRSGSSLPYNGNLYSLIVRGAASTDAQIASTETWVNGKTMAY